MLLDVVLLDVVELEVVLLLVVLLEVVELDVVDDDELDDDAAASFNSSAAMHQVLLPESVPLMVSLPPVAALSPAQ